MLSRIYCTCCRWKIWMFTRTHVYDRHTFMVITIMMSNAVCHDRQPGNWPIVIISDVSIPSLLIWSSSPGPALSLPHTLCLSLIFYSFMLPTDANGNRPNSCVISMYAVRVRISGDAVAFCVLPSLATDFADWACAVSATEFGYSD